MTHAFYRHARVELPVAARGEGIDTIDEAQVAAAVDKLGRAVDAARGELVRAAASPAWRQPIR